MLYKTVLGKKVDKHHIKITNGPKIWVNYNNNIPDNIEGYFLLILFDNNYSIVKFLEKQ